MDELTPIFRIEHFLDEIVNGTVCPYSPEYRVEFFLAKIAGHDVETPEPIFRIEKYLAYLCGEEVELPEPIFRVEFYLAAICGMSVEVPEPVFRVEFWLYDWSGGGGIEKTVTGNPIHITDALARAVNELKVAFSPVQDLHGYENPWPAGGGKNLINVQDQTITGTPTKIADITTVGVTYTASADISDVVGSNGGRIRLQYELNGTTTYSPNGMQETGRNTATLEIPSGATNAAVYLQRHANASSIKFSNIMLEVGSTATPYAPYSNICPITGWTGANIYDESSYDPTASPKLTVTWQDEAGTVYGGNLVINEDGSGVLSSRRVKKIFDGTETISYSRTSSTLGYAMYSLGTKSTHIAASGISNMLKPVKSGLNTADWSQHVQNSSAYNRDQIAFRFDNSFDGGSERITVNNYVAELARLYAAGTPLEVVYELATPIEYDLADVTPITLLANENNLWSDTNGDLTLSYYADGNVSTIEALNTLLGGRYVNNHGEDEPTDEEALNIILGETR